MLLAVIAVLSIVLAFPTPIYRLLADRVDPNWVALIAVVLAVAAPVVLAYWINARSLRVLERAPAHPGDAQFFFAQATGAMHWLLGLAHVGLLTLTDWQLICRAIPVVGDWPLVGGGLAILPFLITILWCWIALFPSERAVRQVALEVHLFRGRPIRPIGDLRRYLDFNFRHQVLWILIPMLLILAARDVIAMTTVELSRQPGLSALPDLLTGSAALLVMVIAPFLLRYIWVTERLPAGPLRDRLFALGKRMGLRFHDVLVWRAGGAMVNAAVMGLIAPLRYVLITDAMLEQMSDEKVEAVFGHEAGHVQRHHILILLLFAVSSGCLVTIYSLWTTGGVGYFGNPANETFISVVLGLVLLLKWGVIFGWISRKLERQADLFGVRTLTLAGVPCDQPCALHAPRNPAPVEEERAAEPPPVDPRRIIDRTAPLCRTAAHVYGGALLDVANLNGISPEARSWRHGSIAMRARIVREYSVDHANLLAFESEVDRIKWSVGVAAVVMSAWTAYELDVFGILAALWGQVGVG